MKTHTGMLPLFQRQTESFDDTFGVEIADVLTAIGRAEDDPVAGEPRVAIDIQRVGYTRANLLIEIDDPFGSGRPVHSVATVRVASRVPHTHRGLHMSRLGDALARSVTESYPDLVDYARSLAKAICRAQYGRSTLVEVHASVPYLEELTRDPHPRPKLSLEQLQVIASARVDGPDDAAGRVAAGVRVSHLVACPCVQKVYAYTRAVLGDAPVETDPAPGFTHNQRCVTTVVAHGLRRPLPVAAVLRQIDGVLFRTMNTLPRGSELSLVHRAHRTPQFIEDALREALWAMYTALGDAPFSAIRGSSRSLESIHDFDLAASATLTPEEASRCRP